MSAPLPFVGVVNVADTFCRPLAAGQFVALAVATDTRPCPHETAPVPLSSDGAVVRKSRYAVAPRIDVSADAPAILSRTAATTLSDSPDGMRAPRGVRSRSDCASC